MKLPLIHPARSQVSLRTVGFTILEVMLAIAIFAMVLAAIYAIWIAILKGSRAGLKAAAEVQRSRIAMRTLQDAFTTSEMFVANMKHYLFVADTSGDMAAVSIAARLPASFPGVGRYGDQVVRRVTFYTEPGKDGMYELIMTQAPILLATNTEYQAYTLTLARDVTLFQLEFFDAQKNEWLEEWKYTNQLPKLVKIALGLGKTAGDAHKPYDVAYSLVALPSVGVGADVQGGGPAAAQPGQTNQPPIAGNNSQFPPNYPPNANNPYGPNRGKPGGFPR
jgi:prepilin-type N-terminal cleavage/methylation domain-containing protein